MFTETELREALEHSAARADDLDVATPKPSRRWLLPVAAAATVAALATGVVVLADNDHGSTAPAQQADRSTAAAASTTAAPTTATPTTAAPRPSVAVDLIDRAVVAVDAEYTFGTAGDRQTGSQTIRHSLGTGRHDGVMTIDIAPSDAIDPSRVERGKKVSIAGTTGWYSALKVYPLDGSTGPGSDKWLPHWTIAFRAPSGDWAFAWIELGIEGDDSNLTAGDVSVDSSSKIVDAYDRLKVQWKDGAARQALRFASLPAGLALTSATFQQLSGKIDSEFLTFGRGKDILDVQLASEVDPTTPQCAVPLDRSATSASCTTSVAPEPVARNVAAGTLTIEGTGFSTEERTSVLRGVSVIPDPADYVGFAAALS